MAGERGNGGVVGVARPMSWHQVAGERVAEVGGEVSAFRVAGCGD